jgi:hypothetical protein
MQARSATFTTAGVKLGTYRLDPSLLSKVAMFTPLPAPRAATKRHAWLLAKAERQPTAVGNVGAWTVPLLAAQANDVQITYRNRNRPQAIGLAEPSCLFHAALSPRLAGACIPVGQP